MQDIDLEYAGHAGQVHAHRWAPDPGTEPRYVALLVHGYGEHVGRYPHVAQRLVEDGAVVYAGDHVGHGRSEGERVLIEGFEQVEEDVHLLESLARTEHPTLPVVLVGHSMGGLIAARYAQRWGEGLACVVLSGPVMGRWQPVEELRGVAEIPDTPIDPTTLSRDLTVGEAYVADELVWHGPFKRPTLDALDRALRVLGAAGPIDRPLLWLHGQDDALVPIEDSRRGWEQVRGPRSEARSYPGARHEIFNETNRDEVLDDVLAFVNAHLPARAWGERS